MHVVQFIAWHTRYISFAHQIMQSPLLGVTYPKNGKAFQLKSAINQIEALEQGMERVKRDGGH